MFNFHLTKKQSGKKSGVKFLATLLLGIQIIPLFLISATTAYAALPSCNAAPTPGCQIIPPNSECFSVLATHAIACFPAGGCAAAQAGTPGAGRCMDMSQAATQNEAYAQKLAADTSSNWWDMLWGKGKDLLVDGVLAIVGTVLEFILKWVNAFAALCISWTGQIMDIAIGKTINSAMYKLDVVNIGWTAVRDLSNMFFIFILLYIAIMTILGLAGGSTKRMVAHLIIAALLINFSLFVTQVVIDSGNVLALGFWNQLQMTKNGTTLNSAEAPFMEAFRLQTNFDVDGNLITPSQAKIQLTSMQRALIWGGGAMVMFIGAYLFLAGALMMIIRTVTLLILMIVSPFAFLGFALPKFGGFASAWFSKLLGATFVAPAFVIMLYLDSIIIRGLDFKELTGNADQAKWGLAWVGSPDNFIIFYSFAVMVILLIGSMVVAKKVDSGIAGKAGGWAKGLIGGGAAVSFAGAAIAGRQIGGRIGKATAESEWLQKQAASGGRGARFLANTALATGSAMKKGTYDIRNAPMGGLGVTAALGAGGVRAGAGSKKNYETHGGGLGNDRYRGTESEAAIIKTANERFKNNPVARDAYLRDRLGAQYEEDRHKDTRTALQRDVTKQDAKKTIEDQTAAQAELDKKLSGGTITKDQAAVEGKAIGDAVRSALTKLSVTERAEMAEKYQDNSAYLGNLSRGDIAAIHRLEVEGKYKAPVIQNITQKVMNMEGSDKVALQQYLMNDETQEKLFGVDYNQLNRTRYDQVKEYVTNKNKAHEEALKENSRRDVSATTNSKEATRLDQDAKNI